MGFLDGFTHYTASGATRPPKYTRSISVSNFASIVMWTSGVVVNGAGEAHLPSSSDYIRIPDEAGRDFNLSFYYRTSAGSFTASEHWLCAFYTPVGTTPTFVDLQCSVRVESDGSVSAYRGGTLLAASSAGALVAGAVSAHIEVLYRRNLSPNGFIKVYVNGVVVLTFTGNTQTVDPVNPEITYAQLGGSGSGAGVDDYFSHLAANAGGSSTSPGGPRVIVTRYPSSSGTFSDWAPTGGADWQSVGETLFDPSTFIDSLFDNSHATVKSSFHFQSLGVSNSILFCQATCFREKLPNNDFSILFTLLLYQASTETDSPLSSVGNSDYTTAGQGMVETFTTTTVNGSAWSRALFDSAEWGVRVPFTGAINRGDSVLAAQLVAEVLVSVAGGGSSGSMGWGSVVG